MRTKLTQTVAADSNPALAGTLSMTPAVALALAADRLRRPLLDVRIPAWWWARIVNPAYDAWPY